MLKTFRISGFVASVPRAVASGGPVPSARPAPAFSDADLSAYAVAGAIETPKRQTFSGAEIAHRAVPMGGAALQAKLAPGLHRFVTGVNVDLMSYTNAFLDHYARERKKAPLSPLAALKTFRIGPNHLQKYRGADCGGVAAQLLKDEDLAQQGWVVPGLAIQYQDPGLPLFNHMAAVVPFEHPRDTADAGVLLLDPGMHLNTPVALRWSNTRTQPVDLVNPGLQENMRFFLEDHRIHFERDPWHASPHQPPGKEDILFGLDRFENYEASVTMPLVAVQDNPRIGVRAADGSLLASIATNFKHRQVNMSWLGQRTHVSFTDVDPQGTWIVAHAPGGDAAGYSAALSHTPDALAGRVHQITNQVDVLDNLRSSRMEILRARQHARLAAQPNPFTPELELRGLAGRTVIFGGSFDPPHMGHALACTYLTAGRGADEVWLMPAFAHADKRNVASYAQRFAMCEIMAHNLGNVRVCDSERVLGGIKNSIDLTDHLRATYPERRFVFALGADLVTSAPTWEGWDRIVATMPVEISPRGGYASDTDLAMPKVASSAIRARMKAGEAVDSLLPAGVADYMRCNRLYAP